MREYAQQYRTVRWTQSHYRTIGQTSLLRFKPLYEIADEAYTIYFPINNDESLGEKLKRIREKEVLIIFDNKIIIR